ITSEDIIGPYNIPLQPIGNIYDFEVDASAIQFKDVTSNLEKIYRKIKKKKWKIKGEYKEVNKFSGNMRRDHFKPKCEQRNYEEAYLRSGGDYSRTSVGWSGSEWHVEKKEVRNVADQIRKLSKNGRSGKRKWSVLLMRKEGVYPSEEFSQVRIDRGALA
ncbi:hypothetical protein V1477_012482, partial [Vespula maculifrons]